MAKVRKEPSMAWLRKEAQYGLIEESLSINICVYRKCNIHTCACMHACMFLWALYVFFMFMYTYMHICIFTYILYMA